MNPRGITRRRRITIDRSMMIVKATSEQRPIRIITGPPLMTKSQRLFTCIGEAPWAGLDGPGISDPPPGCAWARRIIGHEISDNIEIAPQIRDSSFTARRSAGGRRHGRQRRQTLPGQIRPLAVRVFALDLLKLIA